MTIVIPGLGSGTPYRDLDRIAKSDLFCDYSEEIHPSHQAQIWLLDRVDADTVARLSIALIPPGWPDSQEQFTHQLFVRTGLPLDQHRRQAVQHWLYSRGIPYDRTVYVLLDRGRALATSWRIIVRYWEAFEMNCGYSTLVFDAAGTWALSFFHEDVVVFGSRIPLPVGNQQKCPTE